MTQFTSAHLRSVLCLHLAVVASLAAGCATTSGAPSNRSVFQLQSHPVLAGVHADLQRSSEISFSSLKLRAVRVQVLDRVPPRDLVFVDVEDDWRLILRNKSLVPDWQETAARALDELDQAICAIGARQLTEDLARLLLDPDERYGVVVSSPGDIPTNYRSSDVYRDLERRGLDEMSIRSELLRVAPASLDEPRATCADGSGRLVFFTWHYFGGEVAQWTIEASAEVRFERRVLAQGVGSFDYYY